MKYKVGDTVFETANRTVKWTQKYNPGIGGVDLAVEAIECDICDRRGLKNEWRGIKEVDKEIINEINEIWKEIIKKSLDMKEQKQTPKVVQAFNIDDELCVLYDNGELWGRCREYFKWQKLKLPYEKEEKE